MKKYFLIVTLFSQILSQLAFGSFDETQFRYLSPIDLKIKLEYTLPVAMKYVRTVQKEKFNINAGSAYYDLYKDDRLVTTFSYWGMIVPVTGRPSETSPKPISLLSYESLIAYLANLESQTLNPEFTPPKDANLNLAEVRFSLLKKYFPEFLVAHNIENYSEENFVLFQSYWSGLSDQEKMQTLATWVEMTLGPAEVVESYQLIQFDDLVAKLFLKTKDVPNPLNVSLQILLTRDEFLSY